MKARLEGYYVFTSDAPDDFYVGFFMKDSTVKLPTSVSLRFINFESYPDIKISGSKLHACAMGSQYLRQFLPRVYSKEVGPFIMTLMNSITSGAVEKRLVEVQK